jgi:hypothetical protein
VNAWKIILATILIFGTGMVTGGLLVHNVSRQAEGSRMAPPQPVQSNSPDVMRLAFLKQVEGSLHLTPEQHKTIDKILEDSQARMKKFMDPVLPRVKEETEKTKTEFRAELSPEQQKLFDDLMNRPPRPWDARRTMPMPPRGERPGERPGEKQEKRFGRTNGLPFASPFMDRTNWPPFNGPGSNSP